MSTNGDLIRPLFPALTLPDSARVGLLRALVIGPEGAAVRDAVEQVKPNDTLADTDWLTVAWDDDQLLGDTVPVVGVISDQFNGVEVNTALWTVVGAPTVSGGRLRMPVAYPNAGVRSIATASMNAHTATLYGLTTTVGSKNAGLTGIMLQTTAAPSSQFIAFVRYQPNPGYLLMQVGTPRTTQTLVYDAVAHANIRVRVASPSVFFETSPDGTTWTTRSTMTAPGYVSAAARLLVYASSPTLGGQDLAAVCTVDRATWV